MMLGFIKRKSPPVDVQIPPQPECGKDWGAGDVAKCISAGGQWVEYPARRICAGPRKGQVLRVTHVVASHGTVWLEFEGWPGGFAAGHFKKLRPCSSNFLEQLHRPVQLPKARPALPELVR